MSPAADLIYTNGWIFTALSDAPERLAVSVTDGRITALLAEGDVAASTGPDTQVIDLDGALLAPGFQDAHVHPVMGGVELLQCDLSETESAQEAFDAVAAYAGDNPDVEWILGGGWSMEHFPGGTPTRQMLDSIVSDRPVMLSNRDHHGAWVNTRALELVGLDQNTPDPVDGRIEREADGYPAGTVHEGAMHLFNDARPVVSAALAYAGLLKAQTALFAFGITGWQDAFVGTGFGMPDTLQAYLRALDEGNLAAHVVGAQWWERAGGIEQVQRMIDRRDEIAATIPGESLSLNTVKIMVDGVAENFTAAMNTPYRDAHGHDTDNSGLSFIDPELLKTYVTALDAAGFQVHFHSLGDRAVREALDAVEAARAANGPNDNRHHLAHIQVIDPVDTARFASLGAVANMQPLWARHELQIDELTLPFMQDGAEARHYPFGELLEKGARLAAGSDWPVSSADPIAGIHIAVNRVVPGGSSAPLGAPSQMLDLATALTAYTRGTAFVNHREHDTGAIVPGYLANLIVLEPNPFELASPDIHSASVASTWIRGRRVYARA